MLLNISEISDELFELLEDARLEHYWRKEVFLYTLRKSNQNNRLSDGYYFYGNENYLALSFWTGMDWANRTPNIFIRITKEGKIFLTATAKDSSVKSQIFSKYIVEQLGMVASGRDRWVKEYNSNDYKKEIPYFISNEKPIIDKIIQDNLNEFNSEDSKNSVGFIDQDEFDTCLSQVRKYRNGNTDISLPFSLTSFSVEKFGPISKTILGRIHRNIPFVFLAGENGSGKSSILKAIATALSNRNLLKLYEPDNTAWKMEYSVILDGRNKKFSINQFDKGADRASIPFAAYGASRLTIETTPNNLQTLDSESDSLTHPLRSLFFPDSILLDINKWLVYNTASDMANVSDLKVRFDNIKAMLVSIIPNLYDIREAPWSKSRELLYHEEDMLGNRIEKGISFQYLSSGLKSLIAMLGDMMLRLFDQQEGVIDPAALGGIVLIDEIDIHLHPKWQKKLPQLLSDNFPKIQFIVTTHSPIPLLGAPPNSRIYVVKRDYEAGVLIERMDNHVMFSKILPNAILTSPIFGLEEITPVSKGSNTITEVEDNFENIEMYDKLEKEIDKFLTNDKQKELINIFKSRK